MKICKRCRKEKFDSEFNSHKGHKDGLASCCKSCNSIAVWEFCLHRDYGITIRQYELMLKSQNGVCKICGQSEKTESKYGKIKRLAVDHCHKTGKVRGLLCDKCNHGLGQFNDDPELLEKAALYLKGQLCTKKKSSCGPAGSESR